MTNILVYEYYYRYREQRKQIKNLVQSENYVDAKNKIDVTIVEHDNYITRNMIANDGNNFTSNDNLSLKHARKHLNSVLELIAGSREEIHIQTQKQATTDALTNG